MIVERTSQLGVLRAAVDRLPDGSAFAVVGESGAGKTSLVSMACEGRADLRILRVNCDPLEVPRPLGPIKDAGIGSSTSTLSEVCEQAYDFLRAEPTLLVVEDVHWIDAASVDVLQFLCRRIESMPLTLVLTHRELGPQAPARALLGPALRRIDLEPLSLAGVEELVAGTDLDPQLVREVTGGNPFFVAEVAREPGLPMPPSVRDAVLASTAKVSGDDFEALQLIAVAPDRVPDVVLGPLGIEPQTLQRLMDTGLLRIERGATAFRHELARRTIESTLPPGGARRLHTRLMEALESIEPIDPVVLTHHAVAAHDSVRVVRYARASADESIRERAHTEAVAFLEIARDHLGAATEPAERAALLLTLANEQYLVSRLSDAIASVRATFPLWEQTGDLAGLAQAHTQAGMYEYYSAQRRRAEAHLCRAAEIAGEIGATEPYGNAQIRRAFLAFMRGDVATVGRHLLDPVTAANEGIALWSSVISEFGDFAAGVDGARDHLFVHAESARSLGIDELVSTVYSTVATLDLENGRFSDAAEVLAVGLPFTVERDIAVCRYSQTAQRSRLQLIRGDWHAALDDAATVLNADGMPIATVWPYLVRVLIPLRRSGTGDPDSLRNCWATTSLIDEPMRHLAVRAVAAEVAWMTGDIDSRVSEVIPGTAGTQWAAGRLAVWQRRLGLPTAATGTVAEPFRLSLEGRHEEAAAWWTAAGDPFAAAMSWVDSDSPGRGIAQLDEMGAGGTADRARNWLRESGRANVPARPRDVTRTNPGGLTNRQLEVAQLVARGLSNVEIAGELFISPKTTDHHVSAVLAKLGVASRREVLARRSEFGLA